MPRGEFVAYFSPQAIIHAFFFLGGGHINYFWFIRPLYSYFLSIFIFIHLLIYIYLFFLLVHSCITIHLTTTTIYVCSYFFLFSSLYYATFYIFFKGKARLSHPYTSPLTRLNYHQGEKKTMDKFDTVQFQFY